MSARPKRDVLVLHPSDEAYGADRILLTIVQGLIDHGRGVTVALPDDTDPGWLTHQLVALGVPVHRLGLAVARRRYMRPLRLPLYAARLLLARRAVRRLAAATGAGVVHVNTSAILVGAVLGRPGGSRLVWHVHEIVIRPRLIAWLFRLVPPLTGDRVVAVSDAVRRHLTPRGRFRGKVVTVRNGISLDRPVPFGPLPAGGPVVAFVGRFNRWKGQEVFVEAVARVADQFPEARFLIAGSAPPGEEGREAALEAQVDAAGLASRVVQLGFVEDGASVLEAADIAVVPSTWPDPFPTVVLEAMRAGCSIVASAHGGAPEMIEDDVSGLLVPPGDPDALATAIARLLGDGVLRERLGQAGRERVRTEFGVERMVAGIEAAYEATEG